MFLSVWQPFAQWPLYYLESFSSVCHPQNFLTHQHDTEYIILNTNSATADITVTVCKESL